jgi:hypothetical protein
MDLQDQLRREMAASNVFRFMHEAAIAFAPTYKFDKGDPAPLAYDSSEKQRVPAWCDRILFRGSELTRSSAQVAACNQTWLVFVLGTIGYHCCSLS